MTEKVKTNGIKGNKLMLSFTAALIGSIMLIVTLFLPFASATSSYKEILEKYPDEMYIEEIEITNKDAVNISLFEFGKMYYATVNIEKYRTVSIICLIAISVFALFAIFTTLFSVLKKPIAIIIFNVLSLAVFCLLKWDFKDRHIISNSRYDFGIAQYVCFLGVAITFVGAITLLIVKVKQKKQNKISSQMGD